MIIKSREKKDKGIVELIVEVSAEEVNKAVQEVFLKNRNQISVPGFRKGKAPRRIVERMYGDSIFQNEAFDNMMPSVLKLITEESELEIIGNPEVKEINVGEEGGLYVSINAAVYPDIKLGEYKGLRAVKTDAEVAESEIDNEIAGIMLRNARFEIVDRPAAYGDIATIDYEGFINGQPLEGGKKEGDELELGSGRFFPGFEEGIQGMVAGQDRDINIVFPDNYNMDLAGKRAVFKVKLIELREKILPELDDEFAKDVSEFDTLEEYRASIREGFLLAKQKEADSAFKNALMNIITDSIEADIPDVLVEAHMEVAYTDFNRHVSAYGMDPDLYLQMTKMPPDVFRKNMRIVSEKHVKRILALEKIAEMEEIEISEEDIEEAYINMAEHSGMELDKQKESVTKKDIIREIKVKRALDLVVDSAIIEEPSAGVDIPEEPAVNEEIQDIHAANAENPVEITDK